MKTQPFTLSFNEDAMEMGHVWKLDGWIPYIRAGCWQSFQVEPEAFSHVMVFSEDFPAGISVFALLENLKRVRGIAP